MPPTQNEPISQVRATMCCPWYQPLCQITPLSKYLAMVIFIAMPFVGGYIGYRLAPEKVVEVSTTTPPPTFVSNGLLKSECTSATSSTECYYAIPVIKRITQASGTELTTITPYREVLTVERSLLETELAASSTRFLGETWYYDDPSSYILEGDSIYYAPYTYETAKVENKKLVTKVIGDAYALNKEILFANDTLYFKGEATATGTFARNVYKSGLLMVTDTALFSNFANEQGVDTLLKTITVSSGKNFTIKPELDSETPDFFKARPYADGGYLPWHFTDGINFYCVDRESSTSSIALKEPMQVLFEESASSVDQLLEKMDAQMIWQRTDGNNIAGTIAFVSKVDGKKYNQSCKAVN